MSADSAAAKREFLNTWSENEQHYCDLISKYPACGCETAEPAEGGHGPIEDQENLLFLINSPSGLTNAKKRKFNSSIFNRVFTRGMSVVRMDKAEKEEVEETAQIQFEKLSGDDKGLGGVVGYTHFPCASVRYKLPGSDRICFVLDTPLGKRKSHADVIFSKEKYTNEEKAAIKACLFNQTRANENYVKSEDCKKYSLTDFLPEFWKKGGSDKKT